LSQIVIQRNEFLRLGVIGDWEHPFFTMDFMQEANIIRSLATIIKNQHVQKGVKPVQWCLDCASRLQKRKWNISKKVRLLLIVRFTITNSSSSDFLQRFTTVQKVQHLFLFPFGQQHHGHYLPIKPLHLIHCYNMRWLNAMGVNNCSLLTIYCRRYSNAMR